MVGTAAKAAQIVLLIAGTDTSMANRDLGGTYPLGGMYKAGCGTRAFCSPACCILRSPGEFPLSMHRGCLQFGTFLAVFDSVIPMPSSPVSARFSLMTDVDPDEA